MEQLFRDAGVTFVRANSRYFEEDETGVTVRYFAGGKLKEERFNYVVLAMALRPNPELAELSPPLRLLPERVRLCQENEPLTTDARMSLSQAAPSSP